MAKTNEPAPEVVKPKSGLLKKLLLPVIGLLLLGGGVFGGMMLGGGNKGGETTPDATTGDEIVSDAGENGGHGTKPVKTDSHGNPIPDSGSEGGTFSRRDLTFDFGKITVNLQSKVKTKSVYVQASIQLEANTPEGKLDIEDNVAPLRDATIMLLSSKQQEEVQTPAGMERLKRELLVRYEGLLGPHVVRNIYITELLVV